MNPIWPALLLAGILPFGGDREAENFPVEAEGEIRFDLDAARFPGSVPGWLEIYLAVPQATLAVSPDSTGFAAIDIDVRFEDLDGDEIARAGDRFWVPLAPELAGDATLARKHLVTLRPRAPEQTRQIRVRIEDPSGQRRGVLNRIRGKKAAGEGRGRFESAQPACAGSDLLFAWDVASGPVDRPLRSRIQANPRRYYGLFHSNLLLYFERSGASGPLSYRLIDGTGKAVYFGAVDSARTAQGATFGYLWGQDLSNLPAGAYRAEVRPVGADSCVASGEFQILWDEASWNRNQQALLDEAFVLLSSTEYERVREMSRGEVEVYMERLWAAHDPDPATGRNELQDLYEERVDHSDRFFGTSFRRGSMTDRGRVFVRYGPPDEITKELNPQDQDILSRIIEQEVETDRVDIIRKPQPMNSRTDRAYEIWRYTIRGAPLFPDQENPVQHTGLKFIFVDELGYGDMRLVYTNLAGAF